jgi:hypothetical protein
MNLLEIAEDIRRVVSEKQKELSLTFEEERHIYTMKDPSGRSRSDWPSVSKILKKFYAEFPAKEIAYKKANGDEVEMNRLLQEWKDAGTYATNLGSRVHYMLEQRTLQSFDFDKEVRMPVFNCDLEQEIRGDNMVAAGTEFIDLMKERGAVLLDTEMVLGHPDLGYTGQPDKVWLMMNKSKTAFGLVITDWKTNKEKNFKTNRWTKQMYHPFQEFPDNALGHYYLQLPFYGRLLLKMLEGTKYEGMPLLGGVVVLLRDDGTFEEFKIPKKVQDIVMSLTLDEIH